MIVFWIIVALFLAGALLLILPNLLRAKPPAAAVSTGGANAAVYRDQLLEAERDLSADLITPERFEQTRAEIQRRVLEDAGVAAAPAEARPSRWAAVLLAVVIPLGSVVTYLVLGEPEAVLQSSAPAAQAAQGGQADGRHSVTSEQIQKMVAALAERLKNKPDDAEGWLMLGRSYAAIGRYRDSVTAFQKANELVPRNPDILADLADVMGMAQGKRLQGPPTQFIQQALDIDPRHVKALALAGSVAFEAKDYANAKAYWQRLLAVVPEGSDLARSISGSIAEVTQLEGGAPAAAAMAAAPPTGGGQAAPATGAEVAGQVIISPELAAKVGAGDTLFVFARAAQGPRMPLAILRRQASDLPLTFTLNDSMAMSPNMKISGFPQVVVGARISKSGQATPQSGDLMGQSAPVAPGAQGLRIVIDTVQP